MRAKSVSWRLILALLLFCNFSAVSNVSAAADPCSLLKPAAYVKGSLITVALLGPDARARKEQVIALLKAAAGRM